MNINSIALNRLLKEDDRFYVDLRGQVEGQCEFVEFCDDKNIAYFTGEDKPEREEVEACLAEIMLFIPEEQMNKSIELAYADVVKLGKNDNGKMCGLLRIERDFL
jgi:hypothetical protein